MISEGEVGAVRSGTTEGGSTFGLFSLGAGDADGVFSGAEVVLAAPSQHGDSITAGVGHAGTAQQSTTTTHGDGSHAGTTISQWEEFESLCKRRPITRPAMAGEKVVMVQSVATIASRIQYANGLDIEA